MEYLVTMTTHVPVGTSADEVTEVRARDIEPVQGSEANSRRVRRAERIRAAGPAKPVAAVECQPQDRVIGGVS